MERNGPGENCRDRPLPELGLAFAAALKRRAAALRPSIFYTAWMEGLQKPLARLRQGFMRSVFHSPIVFSSCLLLTFHAFAHQGPVPHRIQQPLYLQTVTLLPAAPQTLETGLLEVRIDSAYSNLYELDDNGTFDIDLDMELWQQNWSAAYGFFPGWEVNLALPLLHFEGGFLDSFIQNFHNAFGLPNGGRETSPNGTFVYRIRHDGVTIYSVNPRTLHAGDLTVALKNLVLAEEGAVPAIAWRFAFKFPSGDPDLGLGSGKAGFGFGLAAAKSYQRLHGYLNVNYLVDGGNERLQNIMNNTLLDFSLAGEFAFSKKISALVQLVGGTPRLTGTGLQVWDGIPLDFLIGARGAVRDFFWQVAFSEDIRAVGPSVDFTTFLSIGYRFRTGAYRPYRGEMWAKREN